MFFDTSIYTTKISKSDLPGSNFERAGLNSVPQSHEVHPVPCSLLNWFSRD